MSVVSTPGTREDLVLDEEARVARSWETVVWNDPVNLMSYVVHVFREYFGFSHARATQLMLSVHNDGFGIVAQGAREQMELHAQAMHDYGLWATIRQAST